MSQQLSLFDSQPALKVDAQAVKPAPSMEGVLITKPDQLWPGLVVALSIPDRGYSDQPLRRISSTKAHGYPLEFSLTGMCGCYLYLDKVLANGPMWAFPERLNWLVFGDLVKARKQGSTQAFYPHLLETLFPTDTKPTAEVGLITSLSGIYQKELVPRRNVSHAYPERLNWWRACDKAGKEVASC